MKTFNQKDKKGLGVKQLDYNKLDANARRELKRNAAILKSVVVAQQDMSEASEEAFYLQLTHNASSKKIDIVYRYRTPISGLRRMIMENVMEPPCPIEPGEAFEFALSRINE